MESVLQIPKSEPDGERDPYTAGLVSRELSILKTPLAACPVGILTNVARKRDLRLINPASRVVRAQDVLELTCTTEHVELGELVRDVAYLAFIVFPESGVLARGDLVRAGEIDLGVVLGFNEVHAPNHINIIVRTQALVPGRDRGWGVKTALSFRRPDDEALDSGEE